MNCLDCDKPMRLVSFGNSMRFGDQGGCSMDGFIVYECRKPRCGAAFRVQGGKTYRLDTTKMGWVGHQGELVQNNAEGVKQR